VLVEGDSQTAAPKIEVWRAQVGDEPIAQSDPSVLAVVTDDPIHGEAQILRRSDVGAMADWLLRRLDVPLDPRAVTPPG